MKRLLCFGASNTYGYRPVDGRFAYQARWTGLLATALGADWQLVEAGLNGRTAGCYDQLWPELNGSAVISDYLRRHAPLDALALMLGSNDIIYAPAQQVADDMCLLLQQICSHPQAPTRVILLAPPLGQLPQLGYGGARQLAPLYCQLAEELGLIFADCSQWQLQMSDDGCHLTADDHQRFARRLYQLMQANGLL